MARDMIEEIRHAEMQAAEIEKQAAARVSARLALAAEEAETLRQKRLEETKAACAALLRQAEQERGRLQKDADGQAAKQCAALAASAVKRRPEAVRQAASLLLTGDLSSG